MRAGVRNTVLPALVVSALPPSVRAQGRGVPSGVVFYSAREGNNEIFDPDLAPESRDVVFTPNRSGNNDRFA